MLPRSWGKGVGQVAETMPTPGASPCLGFAGSCPLSLEKRGLFDSTYALTDLTRRGPSPGPQAARWLKLLSPPRGRLPGPARASLPSPFSFFLTPRFALIAILAICKTASLFRYCRHAGGPLFSLASAAFLRPLDFYGGRSRRSSSLGPSMTPNRPPAQKPSRQETFSSQDQAGKTSLGRPSCCFDGKDLSKWESAKGRATPKWVVKDGGLLRSGRPSNRWTCKTREKFRRTASFHVEWGRTPPL